VSDGDPVAVAREIALRQLTVRQRTRAELQAALARRNVPEDAAREVLDRFTEVGLLDDAAFARDWVAGGARRSRGRRVLARELATKGVAPELIEDALAATDPHDDLEVALALARRKLRTMDGLDRQVRFRRLCAALERRGFPRGVIIDVVRQVLDGDAGDDSFVDG
jgi:regulatory protein